MGKGMAPKKRQNLAGRAGAVQTVRIESGEESKNVGAQPALAAKIGWRMPQLTHGAEANMFSGHTAMVKERDPICSRLKRSLALRKP